MQRIVGDRRCRRGCLGREQAVDLCGSGSTKREHGCQEACTLPIIDFFQKPSKRPQTPRERLTAEILGGLAVPWYHKSYGYLRAPEFTVLLTDALGR
jgi:hypothetical protein